jgi:hypothetical protein
MKKLLYTLSALALLSAPLKSQDDDASENKWRFGLRITPQPSWFKSGDKNNTPVGAVMGFGFGLNVERRLTSTASLLLGIGGDIEGGKYNLRNDSAYRVVYWVDAQNEFVKPGTDGASKVYHLKSRKISTTHVTIPVILKLSTKEYGGFKYFGMFGTEVAVRIKSVATDTYHGYITNPTMTNTAAFIGEFTEKDIDIAEESSLIPLRLGLNVGAGTEYRLGGSTSLFMSINYFMGFTNLMKKESKFHAYGMENGEYRYVKPDLKQNAIRINIGIMF